MGLNTFCSVPQGWFEAIVAENAESFSDDPFVPLRRDLFGVQIVNNRFGPWGASREAERTRNYIIKVVGRLYL